jgi:hypothetical protein
MVRPLTMASSKGWDSIGNNPCLLFRHDKIVIPEQNADWKDLPVNHDNPRGSKQSSGPEGTAGRSAEVLGAMGFKGTGRLS